MPAATGLKPTGEVPLLIELQLPTASGSTPHPLSYHLLQRLSHLISSQACLGTHTLPVVSQCLLLGICVLPHPFDWQVAPTLDIIEAMAATRSVGVREAAIMREDRRQPMAAVSCVLCRGVNSDKKGRLIKAG
jgi:hypothetical protein